MYIFVDTPPTIPSNIYDRVLLALSEGMITKLLISLFCVSVRSEKVMKNIIEIIKLMM